MALVTLANAKIHLRITDTDHDADITLKLAQAELVITGYLKSQADPTWTDVTVPADVQAAILLMLTHLYEHRGDEMKPDEDLWNAIARLLMRRRDPALA